jgi:hypothetical protein
MSQPDEPLASPHGGQSRQPACVPGIYNFCDRWCERCMFQQRCRVYLDVTRMQLEMDQGMPLELAAVADEASDQGPPHPVSASEQAEFQALLAEINRPPSQKEIEETTALMEASRRRREAHPLSIAGRDYAETARRITAVLRPLVEEKGDPVAIAATETIDRFAFMIAVKIWRAVGSMIDHAIFGDDDGGAQSDANGSAKIVRLMVIESRDAWEVLTQIGRAMADGVPAAMITRLDALDAAVADEFPEAMAFVRPGFDEQPASQ